MTGYATAQSQTETPSPASDPGLPRLGLELRSVNSRFLDLSFRLPDSLRGSEPALRELLTASIRRGKVELRLTLETTGAGTVPEPSVRLLQKFASVQDQIQAWLPDARPLGVADVLRWAEAERQPDVDASADVLALARVALKSLLDARAREGSRLVAILLDRLQTIRQLMIQATPLVPGLVQQQRQRFLERWNEALGEAGAVDAPASIQDRALAEATAFAIRIDVAEELARLAAHLDEIERLLNAGGEVGKRLDFLIQELHREANTLGSKSAALALTHIAVDMKVLVEQMREQVQNIE